MADSAPIPDIKGLSGGPYNQAELEAIERGQQLGYRAGLMAVARAVEQLIKDAPNPPYRPPSQRICGVVCPHATPNGHPVACAWAPDHLPESPHSWADLPTVTRGGSSHDRKD